MCVCLLDVVVWYCCDVSLLCVHESQRMCVCVCVCLLVIGCCCMVLLCCDVIVCA